MQYTDKIQIIQSILQSPNQQVVADFIKYLEILIQEHYKRMESAAPGELVVLQARLRAYREIINAFTKTA